MSDKPNLQLGDPPAGLVRKQNATRGKWLLVGLQIATLVVVVILLSERGGGSAAPTDAQRVEELRTAAISLEERSLSAEAATSWSEYLRAAPGAEDRATVLYRIGELLMQAEDFSGAVAALVQAEQLGDDDLKDKVGPKIVKCLRRLGRYGEVGRELSRQVEVGADEADQSEVLATFAGEKFTEADLDRVIERTIDRLLAMQPPDKLQIGREQLLKQYESAEARQRMLRQMIQRELFSRRARELKIDQESAFQENRQHLETELLASQFVGRELAKIQPTDVDIESFYSANQANYRQPETASVVVLPLMDKQKAEDVLSAIKSADDFRNQAKKANGDTDVTPFQIVKGQRHHQLGETAPLFDLKPGKWTTSPINVGNEKSLVLVESKTPATTTPLSQIRFRVEADYRSKKQDELRKKLSDDLTARYDVKIMVVKPKEQPKQHDSDKKKEDE